MVSPVAKGILLGALATNVGNCAGNVAAELWKSPPPVEPQDVRLVRMLDVTIKDSNTTNRRQRFECLPVKETR